MTARIPENIPALLVDWSLVTIMGDMLPPRDPNDDDDEDEEDEEDEDEKKEPPVIRDENAVAVLLLSGASSLRFRSGGHPAVKPTAPLSRHYPMMHGTPARVLAQHLGRNLRFKGSPLCDRPRSNSCRHQCRSRQAPSEHARPLLGQRTMEFTS